MGIFRKVGHPGDNPKARPEIVTVSPATPLCFPRSVTTGPLAATVVVAEVVDGAVVAGDVVDDAGDMVPCRPSALATIANIFTS